jgi:hypothetical protein
VLAWLETTKARLFEWIAQDMPAEVREADDIWDTLKNGGSTIWAKIQAARALSKAEDSAGIIKWSEWDGTFAVQAPVWVTIKTQSEKPDLPFKIPEIWETCFDTTVVDHYDDIETALWRERNIGS